MQGNLNDIIYRIKAKLNNFTQQDNSMNFSVRNRAKINKNQEKNCFEYQNQEMFKDQKVNKYNLHKQGQQIKESLLKSSKSCEMIQINKNKSSIKKQTLTHSQTYISLRKRNKDLQNDVKNLKERLKALEQSVEKGKTDLNINKNNTKNRKQKQIIKNKNKQRFKKSGMNSFNIEQKNIQKQPFTKNHKFIFHKNSYNSEAKSEKNKLSINTQKNIQKSLHFITFNSKMKSGFPQSVAKKSKFKSLQRCTSYDTLEPQNQQAINQGKQNAQKLKHNISIADSFISNTSYLRPVQREKEKKGNINANFSKRVNANDKLKKVYKNKIE